jgi:WD40 repeat protein/predicted Ser/Thr protein kinase
MENVSELVCQSCGASVNPNANFCQACGRPIHTWRTPEGYIIRGYLLKKQYRILKKLGEGGMGNVYQAEDARFNNRLLAVKEMTWPSDATFTDRENSVKAFRHEAELLAALSHPGVPHVYDHFQEGGFWYMVMDYIDGETLKDYVERAPGKCLSIEHVIDIGEKLCSILDYLHNFPRPIIFHDLTPANVMITKKGYIYLIDFGIARHYHTIKTNDPKYGTDDYAPPEQFKRGRSTSHLSDIYSLGAILHDLLAGMENRLQPFSFDELNIETLPGGPELTALITQMVNRDQNKRPEKIEIVQQELGKIKEIIRDKQKRDHLSKFSTARIEEAAIISLSPSNTGQASQSGQASGLAQPRQAEVSQAASGPEQVESSSPITEPGQGANISSGGTTGPAASSESTTDPAAAAQKGTLVVEPPPPPPLPPELEEREFRHVDTVWSVAWSRDGKRLAAAGMGVQIWDALTGRKGLAYQKHEDRVRSLAWSPDGRYIVSAGWDQAVHVWNTTTGYRSVLYKDHMDHVRAVAWSPDSQKIASAGRDKTVRIWNAMNSSTARVYRKIHSDEVNALAWSPDSLYLASGSNDTTAKIIDASTGQILLTYKGHGGGVNGVAWSPNAPLLASCGEDRKVQVWNAVTGASVCSYTSHESGVYAVAWSSDGLYLASASRDKTVHVWEAATGDLIASYHCSTSEALSVAWCSGEPFIAYSDSSLVQVKRVS